LIFTSTFQPGDAAVVLGYDDFGVGSPGSPIAPPTQKSLNRPSGIAFDGTRLYVADTANNRIMVWNGVPAASGTPADLGLRQPDFSSSTGGPAANRMLRPGNLSSDGGHDSLYVTDTTNKRVLIWTPFPTSGVAASGVLGFNDLTTMIPSPQPPSSS